MQMVSTPRVIAFWILCMSSPGMYNNALLARISLLFYKKTLNRQGREGRKEFINKK
jgi:hypothetical protein